MKKGERQGAFSLYSQSRNVYLCVKRQVGICATSSRGRTEEGKGIDVGVIGKTEYQVSYVHGEG